MTDYALGIDLGTTKSCAALIEYGEPRFVEDKTGHRAMPSMVAVAESGKILVGHAAYRQAITNATHTFYALKRLMGRCIDDPEAQVCLSTMPYEIVEGPHRDVRLCTKNEKYSTSELLALILCKLRQTAENEVGTSIQRAVLTVPAYFNDAQRQAMIDAGNLAGLEIIGLIQETTAAGLICAAQAETPKTVALFDLGGGTFDISIARIDEGTVTVLSSSGDTFLGGADFDNRVMEHLVLTFAKTHDYMDLRKDAIAMQRLRKAAEQARCELSDAIETTIHLPLIQTAQDGTALHLDVTLTRAELENMVIDLVKRTLKICQIAMRDANVTQDDIDEVILCGGMTRMPLISQAISEFFHQTPVVKMAPEEIAAAGAAFYANALLGHEPPLHLVEVTPFSLGVAIYDGKSHVILPKNTVIPCHHKTIFTTSVDHQDTLRLIVFQGDADVLLDNRMLAEFTVSGIPSAPAGTLDIEITFHIDTNGILSVFACDPQTSLAYPVTTTARAGLTPDDIDALKNKLAPHIH